MSQTHFYSSMHDNDIHVISGPELIANRITAIIIFLTAVTALGLGIYNTAFIQSNDYITTIEPFNILIRSIEEGSGLLIQKNGQIVKIKNTGVYAAIEGPGISISDLVANYPVISINQSYVNSILNLSSLNASGLLQMTPNPWNPSTSGNALIEIVQQGFMAVYTANTAVAANANIDTSWSISLSNTWSKGGFDVLTGIYTIPTSGIYAFTFRVAANSGTGLMNLVLNGVDTFATTGQGSVYQLATILNLNAGDTISISPNNAKTITGGTIPYLTWFSAIKLGA